MRHSMCEFCAVYVCMSPGLSRPCSRQSSVKDSSVITVQIFDQKKFKRKDQGFLGVINIKVSQVIDLELGGEGELCLASIIMQTHSSMLCQKHSPVTSRSPMTTLSYTESASFSCRQTPSIRLETQRAQPALHRLPLLDQARQ